MLPEELSPANGVPTPGVPGFFGKPFSSDRVESLMFCLQELPGAWRSDISDGHAAERRRIPISLGIIYLTPESGCPIHATKILVEPTH